jgi:thioesterase domain-containing protein
LDYVCADLAKAIGDDHPLVSITLTAQDFASFGEAPTLESIAACALRKIMAVQPNGPYILGGLCRGGIVAYEIAPQLRVAGHEVDLVVLLNAPNPSYVQSCDLLTHKVRYLGYALKRASRIGMRTSLVYLCEHLSKHFAPRMTSKSAHTATRTVNEMMQAAAVSYQPEKYDGEVLLLLASEHPPHVNLLSGWQALVAQGLHMQYVDGHHRDFAKGKNVRSVADAILFHLSSGDIKSLI